MRPFLRNWLSISILINGKDATDGQILIYDSSSKRFEPEDLSVVDIAAVIDEDDMASNDNTKVPTQQSVKSYVDNSIATKTKAVLHTTAGGAAAEAVTVAGAAVGDVVVAVLNTAGATPRTITKAKVTATDTVTVTFSGDPSTDHVVNIVVVKP